MDLTRQAETMIDLLSSDHTEEDDIYQRFNLGRGSSLYVTWLWDGILLWGNEIRLDKLSYPMTLFNENDYLLLNICHAGRCEVELSPGTYVYMSPGTLNVSASPPKSSYCYPGGYYEGIEVCLDLRRLKGNMPEALADYGLKFDVLRRYTEEGNVMASLTNAGIQEEEKLFRMLREGHSSVYELRFAALSLICHLIGGDAQWIDCGISITKGQRRIVTEAEQLMTNDLRERYTVEELSSRFGISASAFKKYFSAVYGKPVSQYMREKRMEKAKELLETTNESIGEIALESGYEHQGKFGSAFKDCSGVSPLEYRRLNRKTSEEL